MKQIQQCRVGLLELANIVRTPYTHSTSIQSHAVWPLPAADESTLQYGVMKRDQ